MGRIFFPLVLVQLHVQDIIGDELGEDWESFVGIVEGEGWAVAVVELDEGYD